MIFFPRDARGVIMIWRVLFKCDFGCCLAERGALLTMRLPEVCDRPRARARRATYPPIALCHAIWAPGFSK